jgi:hypothetical protein
MKIAIKDLVGRSDVFCDDCGCPGCKVEPPRYRPAGVGAYGPPPPVFPSFPPGAARVERPAPTAVVPRGLYYILACPRCGNRSLVEWTQIEVPDPAPEVPA